jgi:hypothetical protein
MPNCDAISLFEKSRIEDFRILISWRVSFPFSISFNSVGLWSVEFMDVGISCLNLK